MGGLVFEIEPCSLQNGQNTGPSGQNLLPPVDLEPSTEALWASLTPPRRALGNFTHNYQVVHSGGRSNNNLKFRREQWIFVPDLPDNSKPRVFFESDYGFFTVVSSATATYPWGAPFGFPRELERKCTDSIFVTTFSAPGDRTTSDGFRDRESMEFCSYSTVNYRNFVVRKDLDDEWSL